VGAVIDHRLGERAGLEPAHQKSRQPLAVNPLQIERAAMQLAAAELYSPTKTKPSP